MVVGVKWHAKWKEAVRQNDSYLWYLAWYDHRCCSSSRVPVVASYWAGRCSLIRLADLGGACPRLKWRWRIGCRRRHLLVGFNRLVPKIIMKLGFKSKDTGRENHLKNNIQSLLNLVCVGPWLRLVNATHTTTMPTRTTIIVAATGTAMFRSTHSGNHGNNILTSGDSLIGGSVPADRERKNGNHFTFMVVAFSAQHTYYDNGHDNDKDDGHGGYHKVQVAQDNLDSVLFRDFAGWRNSTWKKYGICSLFSLSLSLYSC